MTELYDDCNWKKQKSNKGLAILANDKFYLINEETVKSQIEQQSAFEKWREGLDWGDKKTTDDNCTGDLILP